MEDKVSGLYRAGAFLIALCSVLCFGLMLFVLFTETFDIIILFVLLLSAAVDYYSGHVGIKGTSPKF